MKNFIFGNMNEAYPALIDLALKEGEIASPRGFICHELRPFSFTLLDPRRSIYGGKSRKLSARFCRLCKHCLTHRQYRSGWFD